MANKVYILNFNGVLDDVINHYSKLDKLTDNYHDASVFVTWQDIRGDIQEFCELVKYKLNKLLLVYQHGRGATRDYGPPNNFKLIADKIMVWGETERQRLLSFGITDDRIDIVGCTLLSHLKPRDLKREGKNILFIPVISEKEEPENLLVYAKLKEWESGQLIQYLADNYSKLKQGWAHQENHINVINKSDGTQEHRVFKQTVHPWLPRGVTYSRGLVNVKLTGVHDQNQYMSPLAKSNPASSDHIESIMQLLANTDVMVCLEEGTMQLLACALDIPVIVVDIFKYGTYGGIKDYDRIEKISTNAVYRTKSIEKLPNLLNHALSNSKELRKARIRICENEGGAHLGDANADIIKIIDSYLNVQNLIKV